MLSYVPKPASIRKTDFAGARLPTFSCSKRCKRACKTFSCSEWAWSKRTVFSRRFWAVCNGLFSAETAAFETLNVSRLGFRVSELLKLTSVSVGQHGFFQGGFLAFQPFFGGLALFLKGCDPFLENSVRRRGLNPVLFSAANTNASAWVQETVSPA